MYTKHGQQITNAEKITRSNNIQMNFNEKNVKPPNRNKIGCNKKETISRISWKISNNKGDVLLSLYTETPSNARAHTNSVKEERGCRLKGSGNSKGVVKAVFPVINQLLSEISESNPFITNAPVYHSIAEQTYKQADKRGPTKTNACIATRNRRVYVVNSSFFLTLL